MSGSSVDSMLTSKQRLRKKELPTDRENNLNKAKFVYGEELFDAEKYTEAIAVFSPLVEKGDIEARQYLGRCFYRLRNFDAASEHFQYLADHSDEVISRRGVYLLAAVEGERGRLDEAIKLLEPLSPKPGKMFNLALQYWKKYIIEGKVDYLDMSFDLLESIDLRKASFHLRGTIAHLKAQVYHAKGNPKKAEKLFKKALEVLEKAWDRKPLIMDYAKLLVDCGREDEAKALVNESKLFIQEKNPLEELLGSNMMEKAKQLFKEEKYKKAIELFLILAEKGDILARQYLARCYFRLEDYDIAYTHFKALSENADENMRDYGISMIAGIEQMWGNYDKAIRMLKSLPEKPRNLIILVAAYWKKAQDRYNASITKEMLHILRKIDIDSLTNENRALTYHLYALTHQTDGEFRLATSYYEKAISGVMTDVTRSRIYNDYASLHILMSNYDLAKRCLDVAKSLAEGKSELEMALNNKWRGFLALAQNNKAEAGEYLSEAAKKLRDKKLLNKLANTMCELGISADYENRAKANLYFAKMLNIKQRSEEVKEIDEKIISFIVNTHSGIDD